MATATGTPRIPTGAGGKRHYTVPEMAQLWVDNGGDKKYAIPMALVGFAESGGDAWVVNRIGATGLWQHYPGGEHLKDPNANAALAVEKFKSRGFQPWVSSQGTWGKWFDPDNLKFSLAGVEFVKSHGGKKGPIDRGLSFGGPGADAVSGAVDAAKKAVNPLVGPLGDIANFFSGLGDLILHPRRLLKLILGSVVLLWGINQLSKAMIGKDPIGGARRGATKAAAVAAVVPK